MMKRTENATKAFWFTVLVGMLFIVGCAAAPPVRILPLVGAPAYPPTDPVTVMVLRTEPQRPFETLGQVVLEPEGNALSVPELEQKLREAAASMGANAVVITADMTMQAGGNRMEQSGGQVVSAIAIRFKD
jgi:hypothetical protein